MTDFKYTPKTTTNGCEWAVNDADGTRDVEIELAAPTCCTGYLFLSRADLVAMLAEIDGKSA